MSYAYGTPIPPIVLSASGAGFLIIRLPVGVHFPIHLHGEITFMTNDYRPPSFPAEDQVVKLRFVLARLSDSTTGVAVYADKREPIAAVVAEAPS